MDNPNELSSSPMSFGSSSCMSNGSSCQTGFASASSEPGQSLDSLSLAKLSANLEKLLIDDEFSGYADAEIVIDGVPVGVHRCILASRSQFFHDLFKSNDGGDSENGKPRYEMTQLVPCGKVGLEVFNVFLNYLYTGTGRLKASPPEISTCVDDSCAHDACPPAINYAIELMYASATFQMKELVMLVQRRLQNFVEKAFVEDVIPILVAAHHCQLSHLLSSCVHRIAKSSLKDAALLKELPPEAYKEVRSIRKKARRENNPSAIAATTEEDEEEEEEESIRDKRIRNIHRALDSDDIELMNLLLGESDITLDDAYALHYSVAYCDPKIVKQIMSLNLADVNLRDSRGHTVLHVAARRKEPSVIVALLERGASASEATPDGQIAVAICRSLTSPKEYDENTGKGTNDSRICIEVLEREILRSSAAADMSMAAEFSADDLQARLNYYRDRVALARMLFPKEAGLAIELADASLGRSKGSTGTLREVDLNETPSVRTKRLHNELHSLHKTVEKGMRYFPHCSELLNKILDDLDVPDVYVLENGTEDEKLKKRKRFMELKEEVHKAFSKDLAENHASSIVFSSSSSSSSSPSPSKNFRPRKRG